MRLLVADQSSFRWGKPIGDADASIARRVYQM